MVPAASQLLRPAAGAASLPESSVRPRSAPSICLDDAHVCVLEAGAVRRQAVTLPQDLQCAAQQSVFENRLTHVMDRLGAYLGLIERPNSRSSGARAVELGGRLLLQLFLVRRWQA